MRTRIFSLALTLVWLSGPAFAEEPTEGEARFILSLATALNDPSPHVRAAASEGLHLLGRRASHTLLRGLAKFDAKTLDAVMTVLANLRVESLAEIRELERRPTGKAGKALANLEAVLSEELAAGFTPDADPAIAAEVESIVNALPRNSWTSGLPTAARLVALGRPAIPALLPHLDPAREDELGMRRLTVVEALSKIAGREDVHTLGRLLDDGWEACASVLDAIGDARAVPYLVNALARGQVSNAIGRALLRFKDSRARAPAVAYLDGAGSSLTDGIDEVLQLLVALGASEALPTIRRMRKAPQPAAPPFPFAGDARFPDEDMRRSVVFGRALAGLGDRDGLSLLIDALNASGVDEWLARVAGETLNQVTGQHFWRGSGSERDALRAYSAWWVEHGDALKWDVKKRRFVAR